MRSFKQKLALLAVISVPLHTDSDWRQVHFPGMAASRVSFSNDGLKIQVNNSRTGMLYALKTPGKVESFTISAQVSSLLPIPAGLKQGEGKADDYQVRIGLIIKGAKKLSLIQRFTADAWLKTIYDLARDGLSRVDFYNLGSQQAQAWKERMHPDYELIFEHVVGIIPPSGEVKITHTLPQPQEIVGVWLGADGENLGAQYEVRIRKVQLQLADSEK